MRGPRYAQCASLRRGVLQHDEGSGHARTPVMHLDVRVQPLLARATIHDDRAELGDGRAVGHDVCQRSAPLRMLAVPMPIALLVDVDAHSQGGEGTRDIAVVGLEQHVIPLLRGDDVHTAQLTLGVHVAEQLCAQLAHQVAPLQPLALQGPQKRRHPLLPQRPPRARESRAAQRRLRVLRRRDRDLDLRAREIGRERCGYSEGSTTQVELAPTLGARLERLASSWRQHPALQPGPAWVADEPSAAAARKV